MKEREGRYRIPLSSVLTLGVWGFMFGIKSGLSLDQFLREHKEGIEGGLGQKVFSDSTFARRLSGMDIESLREAWYGVLRRLRRKKVLGSSLRLLLDGSGAEGSYKGKCELCHEKKGQKRKNHYFVLGWLCDEELGFPIDAEPILPGENEGKAAERIWQRFRKHFPRTHLTLVLDAFYKGPFIQRAKEAGIDVVVKVKGDMEILRDAQGLLPLVPCIKGFDRERNERYEIRDVKELRSWGSVHFPLRLLEIVEYRQKPKREEDRYEKFYVVTTLSSWECSAEEIRRMMHQRWHIENKGFRTLKQDWGLGHAIHHNPTAIVAVWMLMCIGLFFVLLFTHRHLWRLRKRWRQKKMSYKKIRENIRDAFICWLGEVSRKLESTKGTTASPRPPT